MAKYAVSQEGIVALKTMASAIVTASDKIKELTVDLKTVVDDNPNTLGPHRKEIEEVINAINAEVKAATEPIGSVSKALEKVANGYQKIIDKGLGLGTGKQ